MTLFCLRNALASTKTLRFRAVCPPHPFFRSFIRTDNYCYRCLMNALNNFEKTGQRIFIHSPLWMTQLILEVRRQRSRLQPAVEVRKAVVVVLRLVRATRCLCECCYCFFPDQVSELSCLNERDCLI